MNSVAISCVLSATLAAAAAPTVPLPADEAVIVARLLDPQALASAAILQMMPRGGPVREFAERELSSHPELWLTLERELADALRETFSLSELAELRKFLQSPTGQVWVRASPSLLAQTQERSKGANSAQFQMASIGCVVGWLAPHVEAAQLKAGRNEPGFSAELFEVLRPSREAVRKTCDCLLRKVIERWPSSTITQIQLQPEYQQYVAELLTTGACPLPDIEHAPPSTSE